MPTWERWSREPASLGWQARSMFGGLMLGFAALASCQAWAQAASPQDEAKLYELAKQEKELVWYSTNGLDESNGIGADFQAKYPGVQVRVVRIVGSQQYQRFLSETNAKQYIADILNVSDKPLFTSLKDEGHIAEWKIPTYDRLPPQYRIGNHIYAFQTTILALMYNKNKVTDEEAKLLESSWKAILDPRFKGRFTVITQKCGMCYAAIHLFRDPKMSDQYPADMLTQIAAQKPVVFNDMFAAIDRVIAGEKDFTFWSWEAVSSTKLAQGAPIRWLYPKPTPAFPNNWFAISQYAPHPNASRLFLNWLGSEDGSRSLQIRFGAAPSLSGVPDVRAFRNESWYHPPAQLYEVDFERWEKNYANDMDSWIKAITN